jgi:hypothetical protein
MKRIPKGQVMVEYFCILCIATILVSLIMYFTVQVFGPVLAKALQNEINYLNTPYWTQPGLNGAAS